MTDRDIEIPALAMVLLVGPSGAGKSAFARRHFSQEEVISVPDGEAPATGGTPATPQAPSSLLRAAGDRLASRQLVVIDARNLLRRDREPWLAIAKRWHVLPVAIAFDLPLEVCEARSSLLQGSPRKRAHRFRQEFAQLHKSLRNFGLEGIRTVHAFASPEGVENARIVRVPLKADRQADCGPFDIIGDVHGCAAELEELLEKLGYAAPSAPDHGHRHPGSRQAVFLGDLVDRGPSTPRVLELVETMVKSGRALAVIGNHDAKFVRAARGQEFKSNGFVEKSLRQFEPWERAGRPGALQRAADFLHGLADHYLLDEGSLVVAHAGLTEELQGRNAPEVRKFCLYGDVTGEKDARGEPVRRDWTAGYRGASRVVYGHVFEPEPRWVNRTIDIDTGCVFGGRLTALRYPEMELVSVRAHRDYLNEN